MCGSAIDFRAIESPLVQGVGRPSGYDVVVGAPCFPCHLRPASHKLLVLLATLGSEHISDGHLIEGRRLEPWPFGTISLQQGLRCCDDPLGVQMVLEPVAETDEVDGDRLPLPPVVLPGMLGGVHVDGVSMDPPVGAIPELTGEQFAKGRPSNRSTLRCRRASRLFHAGRIVPHSPDTPQGSTGRSHRDDCGSPELGQCFRPQQIARVSLRCDGGRASCRPKSVVRPPPVQDGPPRPG